MAVSSQKRGWRRGPGFHLRGKIIKFLLVSAWGAGCLGGLGLGMLVYALFLNRGGAGWIVGGYVVLVVLALSIWNWIVLSSRKWSLANLDKGFRAEMRAGQVLDYAIAGKGCAIAHGVSSIPGTVGDIDIDHLVLLPERLLVIETKYRKVPKRSFPGVLQRLAGNVRAVRCWTGDAVVGEGCLAFYHGENIGLKLTYPCGGEEISVSSTDSLALRIRRSSRQNDEALARMVWALDLDPVEA